ncbi:hypothetical protein KY335_01460 [Candidatus Woesearchaeota archaeon]|nr:hypothetical protein [Candidatus Woesearchaeota archaeon]
MGGNYFAKLVYFITLIVLAALLIPAFSYYKLAWLAIFLVLGIVCFSGAFALSLFFVLNIIIGLVFYYKSGNIIYLELLLVMILGFVASISNIRKKTCTCCGEPCGVSKSEQIKKELGPASETPKVDVYGKAEKKTAKTTKKKATKKKKKTAKKKATKKTAKKRTKKRTTKKKKR